MWAAGFEELVGSFVRFGNRLYRVFSLGADDIGYSERGHLTGYAICRREDYAPSGHPCNPKRLPLHELTRALDQTGQSVSKENQE